MTNKYLYNFDFLRIVFTICIVLFHIFQYYHRNFTGDAGVEFFFILSGFFLMYTLDSQKSYEEFIIKKIIRFWPLVFFITLCMIVINDNMDQDKILAPLFFLPATGMFDKSVKYASAWYIFVLFWVSIFYFYIIKNCNRVFTNICMGLLTFYGYVLCVRGNWNVYTLIKNMELFTTGMARGIAGMGCGYFIALIYQAHGSNKRKQAKPLFKYTILEVLVLGYILFSMFTVDGMRRRIFYVIAFIGLIELFLAKKGHVSQYFEKNSCLSISKYCLSVFLTHQVIISLFGKYNILFGDMILQVFVIFVVCLLFGVAVHHLVEKPATKYLQKQFKMISAHKK